MLERDELEEWNAKLMPCPFCGGRATFVEEGGQIDCGSHGCGTSMYEKKLHGMPENSLLERWNTRAPIPQE